MINLNFSSKALKLSMFVLFVLLIALFLNGMKNTEINDQCYSASYSLVSDYTNEDLPLKMKKKLSKGAKQNKKIYKILQSSTYSFEQVDSIAHICGGQSIMVKPEVVIRTIGQESVDYFYYPQTEQKCYSVQEPEYLDGWKITGPISYENSDDRYFKALKENSDDYVIFDSNTPVSHNLKLIRGIPGLVVEASIGMQRIMLLDFKTSSCSDLADRMKQFQAIDREKVKRADHIDISDFLNPFTDLINSDDFQCVESF
jgi:hypothetical protein